ncbi:MAG: CBS domain-containing protein [Paracoccaceae bacterium]
MFFRSVLDVVAGRALPSIAAGSSVRQAAHTLDQFNVGALVVLRDGVLVGLISERDVIRKCIGQDLHSDTTTVDQIMTENPHTVPAESGLNEAIGLMTTGGFRHLPVMDGDACVALLSIRDIPTEYRMMYERFLEMRGGK